MLLFSDTFPLDPTHTGQSRAQHKQSLKSVGKEAEESVGVAMMFGDKSITMHKVLCHPKIREFESSLELPKNIPECERRMLTNQSEIKCATT